MSKGPAFNSDNFIFRATPLGLALVAAGVAKEPTHMVREAKREGVLRQRQDQFNELPSKQVVLNSTRPEEQAA